MKWHIICLFFFVVNGLSVFSATLSKADSIVLEQFWKYAIQRKLSDMPVNQRIPVIGGYFLGKPYQAGTLNVSKEELPVINLRQFDCVTFVENTLALALLDNYEQKPVKAFIENIIRLRYRNGEIIDYTSRLHYSSDWLFEMQRQHILADVTAELGGKIYNPNVNFMSEHADKYPALKADRSLLSEIRKIEAAINKRTYYYIPKEELVKYRRKIRTGDVILITTSIKGLDTSHVGFAIQRGREIYLMHASSSAKRVQITALPLEKYMKDIRSQTGIMVARLPHLLDISWLALPD